MQAQKLAGPICATQLNQMTYHCGIFRTNYFLLLFIKPKARMANSFTFVLFGESEGSFRGCVVCVALLSSRYILYTSKDVLGNLSRSQLYPISEMTDHIYFKKREIFLTRIKANKKLLICTIHG